MPSKRERGDGSECASLRSCNGASSNGTSDVSVCATMPLLARGAVAAMTATRTALDTSPFAGSSSSNNNDVDDVDDGDDSDWTTSSRASSVSSGSGCNSSRSSNHNHHHNNNNSGDDVDVDAVERGVASHSPTSDAPLHAAASNDKNDDDGSDNNNSSSSDRQARRCVLVTVDASSTSLSASPGVRTLHEPLDDTTPHSAVAAAATAVPPPATTWLADAGMRSCSSGSNSSSSSSGGSGGGGGESDGSANGVGGAVRRPLNAAFALRPRTSSSCSSSSSGSGGGGDDSERASADAAAAMPVIVLATDMTHDADDNLGSCNSSSSGASDDDDNDDDTDATAAATRADGGDASGGRARHDSVHRRRRGARQAMAAAAATTATTAMTYTCNLANLDERRSFVTERVVALAQRMTHTRIVEQLLPAMHMALACDDHAEQFANCAACMARALPDVVAAYLRDWRRCRSSSGSSKKKTKTTTTPHRTRHARHVAPSHTHTHHRQHHNDDDEHHHRHRRHTRKQQQQQRQQQQRGDVVDVDDVDDDGEWRGVACFLDVLAELCCGSGEDVVESATTCLQRLLHLVSVHTCVALLLPFVLELWSSPWSTPRAIAIGALSDIATDAARQRASGLTDDELMHCLALGSRDACALVRIAVVRALPAWVRVAHTRHGGAAAWSCAQAPLSLLAALARDDLCDAVRYEVVAQLPCLAAMVAATTATTDAQCASLSSSASVTTQLLLPCYLAACADRSWRVRYMAARHLAAFAAYVVADGNNDQHHHHNNNNDNDDSDRTDTLMSALASLASDEEHEVRASVARQLSALVACVSTHTVEAYCVPVALRLASDAESVVRSAVVSSYAALLRRSSNHNSTSNNNNNDYNSSSNRTLQTSRSNSNSSRHFVRDRDSGSPAVTLLVCSKLRCLIEDGVLAVQVAALQALEHVAAALDTSHATAAARAATHAGDHDATHRRRRCPDGSRRRSSRSSKTESRPRSSSSRSSSSSSSNSRAHNGTATQPRNSTRRDENGGSHDHHHDDEDDDSVRDDNDTQHEERMRVVRLSLFRALQRQGVSESWRVRQAVVYALRHLCRMATLDDFAPLLGAVRTALCDAVFAVRSTAVDTLACVAQHYGAPMAAQTLTELLLCGELCATRRQSSFVWRILAVRCMAALLPVCDALPACDLRRRQLLVLTAELLQQCACDGVPNVRIAVATEMSVWRAWFACSAAGAAAYNAALQQLQTCSEADVANAAANAAPLATAPLSPTSSSSL